MTDQEIREHVTSLVLEQVRQTEERRREALREYFAVTFPNVGEQEAARIAEYVPPLLPALYRKWADLFVDRLLETIPREQLDELCNDTLQNRATLLLVYIMFMESARMEQQVAEDLKAYGMEMTGSMDMGDMVMSYLREKMRHLGKSVRERQ
jgi:hypothetical protein